MVDPVRPDALTEMVTHLNLSGADYMLVGSAAGSWYGLDRTTSDVDFVLDLRARGVNRFVAAFTPGFYCDEAQIRDAIERELMFNVISHTTGLKADMVMLKAASFHQGAFARRTELEWHGTPVWVTSGADLVLNKLMWAKESGSERQLADVRAILGSGRVELDDYFYGWISVYGLQGPLDASRETRYGA